MLRCLMICVSVTAEYETVDIDIGTNACTDKSICVTAPRGVTWCPTEAGDPGIRINEDHADAPDTFNVSVVHGRVCVKRTDDNAVDWGQELVIRCPVTTCNWTDHNEFRVVKRVDGDSAVVIGVVAARDLCIALGKDRCKAIQCAPRYERNYNDSAYLCNLISSYDASDSLSNDTMHIPDDACFQRGSDHLEDRSFAIIDYLFWYAGVIDLSVLVFSFLCCLSRGAALRLRDSDSPINKLETSTGSPYHDIELTVPAINPRNGIMVDRLPLLGRSHARRCLRCERFCVNTQICETSVCQTIICLVVSILVMVNMIVCAISWFAKSVPASANESARQMFCSLKWRVGLAP